MSTAWVKESIYVFKIYISNIFQTKAIDDIAKIFSGMGQCYMNTVYSMQKK